jgi:hypothetical protein
MDNDTVWFEAQLSLIRWHLDAAISASLEKARVHFQQAQEVHARTCSSLLAANLSEEIRKRLEHECSELKARLDLTRGA